MALTKNQKVLDFVQESASLTQPDKIVWIDGSASQIKALKEEAVKSGELIKLNENLLPDCYLHRTKVNDVARVEDRTFICTKNKEDAGPVNYWMDDVRYPLFDGRCRQRFREDRYRGNRFHLRSSQYEHYDPRRQGMS